MEESKMNKGIEILLERMKSNPEEFSSLEGYANKWGGLVREYEGILDEGDVKAFFEARRALLQDQFTAEVMKELLDPKSQEGVTLNSMAHPTGTLGRSLRTSSTLNNSNIVNGGYTLTANGAGTGFEWGNAITATTLDAQAQQTAQLRAMIDELKVRKEPKKHWWNKTIPELFRKQ
jgi:hypothetical protein